MDKKTGDIDVSEGTRIERLPYLDGWRGIAILLVLISHFFGEPFMYMGRLGVDLFFVLSGLLMSKILFEQRMPIRTFYRRRIARILPAFLAFCLVVIATFEAIGFRPSWQSLVTLLTFTRTYYVHPFIWQERLPIGHIWSLNVEEHCYIVLAVIAAIAALRVRATAILFGLAALTLVAVRLHMKFSADPSANYLLNTECASTCLLLSAAYRTVRLSRVSAWAAPLALLIACACYIKGAKWYLSFIVSPAGLAFSVNHVQDSWRWLISLLERRWLCWIGVLSYSLYIWQQPFFKFEFVFPEHTAILFAIAAGCASYYLLENPMRRFLNAKWRARREEDRSVFKEVGAADTAS